MEDSDIWDRRGDYDEREARGYKQMLMTTFVSHYYKFRQCIIPHFSFLLSTLPHFSEAISPVSATFERPMTGDPEFCNGGADRKTDDLFSHHHIVHIARNAATLLVFLWANL